jgi:hypothetical protein
MNYEQAYNRLAAQVRKLGIVSDVQIEGNEIGFGDSYDALQTLQMVQICVATLNGLTLELFQSPPLVEHDPYECRKCGGDCVTDGASGMRVCVDCGEGQ